MDKATLPPGEYRQLGHLSAATELMCWLIVFLLPILRWINGPPITDDQAAIQVGLFVIALLAAVSLRFYNWRRRRRSR